MSSKSGISLYSQLLIKNCDFRATLQNYCDCNLSNYKSQYLTSVFNDMKKDINAVEFVKLCAETANNMRLLTGELGVFATHIYVDYIHAITPKTFSKSFNIIFGKDVLTANPQIEQFVNDYADIIDDIINDAADYRFSYNSLKLMIAQNYIMSRLSRLSKISGLSKLSKLNNPNTENKTSSELIDRPQYMYMRIAIALFSQTYTDGEKSPTDLAHTIDAIRDYYNRLSRQQISHATPTMYNACVANGQFASCFLMVVADDIENIMDSVKYASIISKHCGGVALAYSNVRSAGSLIKSTQQKSMGIINQLKIFDEAAECWNQRGRKGAFAIYLEPWHADIYDFVDCKAIGGEIRRRTRALFPALWVPDLFIKRVREGKTWSLFNPDEARGLTTTYGDEFEKLYEKYEREGIAVKTVNAFDLFGRIVNAISVTGSLYVCYKDIINRKSNQKNIGIVQSSNLCCEIVEVARPDSIANCILGNLVLGNHIIYADGLLKFDYAALGQNVRALVRALDNLIDNNKYPVDICAPNAHDYRPISIGVQGLADVFAKLRLPFLSPEAADIDKRIFETIYYYALLESAELASLRGSYQGFEGSPISAGIFHFEHADDSKIDKTPTNLYDWEALRVIVKRGVRNSLLVGLMPTATTSRITGSNESFEPFTSNIFVHDALSGKYTVINKYLVEHLIELGIYTNEIQTELIDADGSCIGISAIPKDVREIYKTVYEMSTEELYRRIAIRNAYVDQSSSNNFYGSDSSPKAIAKLLLRTHELGLKTALYYSYPQETIKKISNKIKPAESTRESTPVSKETKTKETKTKETEFCERKKGCVECAM